jgi:hypothetical protein
MDTLSRVIAYAFLAFIVGAPILIGVILPAISELRRR